MSYQSQNSEHKNRTTGSQFLKDDPQSSVPESREPGFRKTFAFGYDPESPRAAMSSAAISSAGTHLGSDVRETTDMRADRAARYGFSTTRQSYAQLGAQAPSISAVPARPDWLDDDDAGNTDDTDNTANTGGKGDTDHRAPTPPREDGTTHAGHASPDTKLPDTRLPDSGSQTIREQRADRARTDAEQSGTDFAEKRVPNDNPSVRASDWQPTDTSATPPVTPP
ncbi:MAG: hypothetical protein WDZ49_02800, partial [Litorilinea sp.]